MTYFLIDKSRIKISLSREEVACLFGDPANLSSHDPKIQRTIKGLLKKAVKDMGFRPEKGSIFADAMRTAGGGLDIYFSSPTKNRYPKEDFYILEFSSLEALSEASKAIVFTIPKLSDSGRLYLFNGKYRLIVPSFCPEEKLVPLVKEFLGVIVKGKCHKAVTEEHGRMVLSDNAVRLMTKL